MPQSDLAAIGTLSVDTGWKLLVNRTRDRTQLAAAIDTLGLPGMGVRSADPLGFAYAAPGGTGSSTGTQSGKGPQKGKEAEEAQRDIQNMQRQSSDDQNRGRVTKLMSSMAAMGRVLDSVRGRKHVLFFSEGFETRLLAGRASGRSAVLEHGTDTATLDAGTNQGAGEAAIKGERSGRWTATRGSGSHRCAISSRARSLPSRARMRWSTRSTSAVCAPEAMRRGPGRQAEQTPSRRWPRRPAATSCAMPTRSAASSRPCRIGQASSTCSCTSQQNLEAGQLPQAARRGEGAGVEGRRALRVSMA